MVEEDEKLNKVRIATKKKIYIYIYILKMQCIKNFIKFITKLPLLYIVQICVDIIFGLLFFIDFIIQL